MRISCCSFTFLNVQIVISCSSIISMAIFNITHLLVITFCATSVSSTKHHSSGSSSGGDTFRYDFPPLISIQHGDRTYEVQNTTLQIANLEDKDFVYFICKAPYPIEWTLGSEVNQSAMGRAFLSHLSISRSFSDFQNKSSYIFTVTSRLRYMYKINYGIKTFRFSCQSIENPKRLCILQSVSCMVDRDFGLITLRTLNDASENNDELCRNSLADLKVTKPESECDSFIYYKEHEMYVEAENDKHLNVIQGPKYSFICKFPDGKSGVIKIHYCSNSMVCNSLFKTARMPRKCAKAVGGNSSETYVECNSCPEKVTRLFTGFIGCADNELDKKIDTTQLLIFFSVPQQGSTSANIHFSMDAAVTASDEMISLSRLPTKNYIGDQLYVTCNVSNYYFAEGASIALKYKNKNELSFLKTVEVGVHDPLHNNGFGVEEASIPIMYDSLERVYCFAPLWNSFSWLNKSRDITIEDIDSESLANSNILKAVAVTFSAAVAIFASFFAIFWLRIVNRKHSFKLLSVQEIQEFRTGNVKRNADLKTSYEEVSQSPYDVSCEIQRERLLLDETAVLGRGHFGLVIKGILKDDKIGANNVEVAVKTIKTKDVASLKALLSELKIMASIGGKHQNVVNLMGACTKKMAKGEVFVAVEFCNNGNLQNYLRSHRKIFHNQVVNDCLVIEIDMPYSQERASRGSSKQDGMEETLTTLDLVRWAWEIARGMEFLSSKKNLNIHEMHKTFRVGNTWRFSNEKYSTHSSKVAKVSDFGLSRQLVDYYYVKKETGPMPWKWMAIESLRDMKFSIQSDVWSYGITLWEIFSLAECPYSVCSWSAEFVITLLSGHRLGRPAYVTTEMYELMRECWNIEPSDRPSFFTAKLFFEDILTHTSNLDYMQIPCSHDFNLEGCFQKLPLLRITEALSPEEDEVFE